MLAMHMANELLTPVVAGLLALLAAGLLGVACRQTRRSLDPARVPLMGVLGAFVFAAQMINFTLPFMPGTSGHLGGGVLLAIVLGPHAGTLVMASILIIQCLIFQDGGLLALGANIFNMGIVASFGAYYIYRLAQLLFGDNRRGKLIGVFTAAWGSVLLASIACAVELAVSGASPWRVVLPAMAGIHALIGIGEGLISIAVVSLVLATRADLMRLQNI